MTSGQPDAWGRARWRLRDLRGSDQGLALALLVLLLVPFAVALVRAFRDGWVPSGDEANIATRALDVFSRHAPLTGLPSTSAAYGVNIRTNHPGPIEFYLLAVPLRVFGRASGPLFTAATINATFVVVAAWVFFRRLGLTVMLWAGVLLLAVMWSGGTAVLTDTLSSNMTLYSLLATAVLAWALIDGDVALLPLAAFVASYAAQQHLAAGLVVVALIFVSAVALAVQIVTRVRRGDPTIVGFARRWSLAAVAVAAVCWAPVVDDQLRGHPGNLTAIVRFARDGTRPTLGFKSGLYQVLHAVAPPAILGRTDTNGSFFLGAPGSVRIVVGVVILGALGAIVWRAWRRSPSRARLALVALVVLVAGVVNGSNIPASPEQSRVNLYRWSWSAVFMTWTALGMGIALLVSRALRRTVDRGSIARHARLFGSLVLLVAAALIATSIVFVQGADDHNRELPEFSVEKRIDAAVLSSIDRRRPVYVTAAGPDAFLAVGPHVIFRLIEAGVTVEVSPFWTSTFGSSRKFRPRSHPQSIVIKSGKVQRASGAGELLMIQPFGPAHSVEYDRLSSVRSGLLDDLSAEALGAKVAFAPGAGSMIERAFPDLSRYIIAVEFANLPVDPRPALQDPVLLRLVLNGVLRTPVLDASKIRQLLDLPAYRYLGAHGDEQVEVHLVKPR